MALKHLRLVAITTLAIVALAGCSAPANNSGSSAGDAACTPSGGTVNLSFTSWVPGMDKVVALWNSENPKIKVTVSTVPNGNSGTYQNFFNQLKAGNAPDIGQVEYDTLPAFRVQDGLANIASCAGVAEAKSKFSAGLWNQVTFGQADSVYAIPQDSGPMGLYYRKDLFDKAGLKAPATWAEYAEAAVKIKALGGSITNFPKNDVNWFAGLVAQGGGQWFSTDNGKWDVSLTSAASTKVASYWQDLVTKKLVTTIPAWTDQWNNSYNTGENWTWVSAVWGANSLTAGAPLTSGKWAVAPMPQWVAGQSKSAAWGGSSTVVFKGSKHPAEAAQFMLWLNTSDEALNALIKEANLYPASTKGTKLPALSGGVEFFGNQAIYKNFSVDGRNISPFTWGPTMTQTYNDVSDGFSAALSGDGTLQAALVAAQAKTIAALKAQSIEVK